MAVADVILQIGSKMGPGGFASLESAIGMVSRLATSISETTKELDAFALMMKRVDMEVINYADSAAKGQVSTDSLMKSMSMLNKAGVNVTQEQFKTLAVRVVDFAKATGRDATTTFEKLTKAIARGSSGPLAEFGIKLKNTTNLQKAQVEAISRLTEGYGDLTVEMETTSERLYALDNNIGTLSGALWSLVGSISPVDDALDGLNNVLGETAQIITELNEDAKRFAFSSDGFGASMILTWKLITGSTREALAAFKEYQSIFTEWKKVNNVPTGEKNVDVGQPSIQKAPRRRGGPKSSDKYAIEDPSEYLTPEAHYWAQMLNLPLNTIDDIMAVYERYDNRGSFDFGDAVPFNIENMEGPFGASSVAPDSKGRDYRGVQGEVDRQLAELKAKDPEERMRNIMEFMEEARDEREFQLQLLNNEAYVHERLIELREEEAIQRQEDNVIRLYQREEALDFAERFGDVWRQQLDGMSAGALVAQTAMNGLKQVWAQTVTAAVEGGGNMKKVLLSVLKQTGLAIAIEAGWRSIMETGRGFSLLAQRQYDAASQAFTSAGIYTGLAVAGGLGAAGASSGLKSMESNASSGVSGSSVSRWSPAVHEQSRPQEVKVQIAFDEKAGSLGFHTMVLEQDDKNYRTGAPSLRGAA